MRTIVVALIFLCLFFFRQIFAGEVWYCCDNLLINIPARVFQKEAGLVWSNPYIFSGTPFIADINLAAFYPGNIVFWLFDDPFGALTTAIVFHFFIAFTGMYTLTKRFVSAIAFSFSGTLVTYTNNLPMLQVAVLLPWVFWAWQKNLVLFVIFASMQIFAGHVQFVYYTWILLLAWVLWFRPRDIPKRLLAVCAVFILTSLQTVPFLQFARESTRFMFGYDYAVFDSLNPLAFVRLVIPWSVGVLNQGSSWAMGGSVYGYVGVLPLILAVFAPRSKRQVKFLLVVVVGSFLLALGKYMPLYPLFYRLIPGLGSFRSPQHSLLIYTFAVSILAGLGGRNLLRARPTFVIAATGLLFAAVISPLALPFISKLEAVHRPAILTLILLNAGLAATLLSLAYKFPSTAILGLLIFTDLFLFTRSNVITLPLSTVTSWFEKSDTLVNIIGKEAKILVHKDLYPAPIEKQFGKFDWPEEAAWQVAILRPNINMLYHIPSIDGYASMISQNYQDSFGVPPTDPTGVNMGEISGKLLRERGVNIMLAPPATFGQGKVSIGVYRVARK